MTVLPERLPFLDTLRLDAGAHNAGDGEYCLLEAAAYIAGEPFTDQPKCVSRLLMKFGTSLNDGLDPDRRQTLIRLIPGLIGTNGDGLDGARTDLIIGWILRTGLPARLDLIRASEMDELATDLRNLPPVTDQYAAAIDLVRRVRDLAAVGLYSRNDRMAVYDRADRFLTHLRIWARGDYGHWEFGSMATFMAFTPVGRATTVSPEVIDSLIALFASLIRPDVTA